MMASARSVKPIAWLKKHWLKVVIAIVVIYVIYWLFFKDGMENFTDADIAALQKTMDDAKKKWDDAKSDQAKLESTLNCTGMGAGAVEAIKTPGCPKYTSAMEILYNTAKKAYDDAVATMPTTTTTSKKKKKRAPSFRSKVTGFFSGIGKSFKKSTQKTKKTFENTFDSGSMEKGIGMRW
jgi:hypothetical protein